MEVCPCRCPNCRCLGKCLCCPTCCACTKCLNIRKSTVCSKCKERLTSHTVPAAPFPVGSMLLSCVGYPIVDFRRLPDLSFLNTNVPPEALGNPPREQRQTVNPVNVQTFECNNPTFVRQDTSESGTSQGDQPLIFQMDDIDDNPEHPETKESTEQTPRRLELHGSFQNISVNLDETGSSITLEYSQDSPTEIYTDPESSSAPAQFLIECKSNESSPSGVVGQRLHLSISQQLRRLCISAPPRTTSSRPFYSPATSTKSTSPQYSPTESCTQSSSTTMPTASQVQVSAPKDTVESKEAENVTSNKCAIEGTSEASTFPRVFLGPVVWDTKSHVRVLVPSEKDQQTQFHNLTSRDSVQENSSLEGTSLVEERDTEADVTDLLQSSEDRTVSSARSSSPSCPSCGGPVSQLVRDSNAPQSSEESQSLNSSPVNNGEASNILSTRISSEDNDLETNASVETLAQEQVTQAVANRPVLHAGNILVLVILLNTSRL